MNGNRDHKSRDMRAFGLVAMEETIPKILKWVLFNMSDKSLKIKEIVGLKDESARNGEGQRLSNKEK